MWNFAKVSFKTLEEKYWIYWTVFNKYFVLGTCLKDPISCKFFSKVRFKYLDVKFGPIALFLIYFRPKFPSYTPWKRRKTFGFLTFLGVIEREHWPEMEILHTRMIFDKPDFMWFFSKIRFRYHCTKNKVFL